MKVRASHQTAVLRLTLPPLLAVLLFVAAMYYLVLPATHQALLERKQETLRAIVASAISLCERHHAAELAGSLSPQQAQALAAADLRALRYGEDNKDYLWVIDHAPKMIAHPYRADLEGQNLAGHTDPDGIRLFVESVTLVDAKGEGFLHYRWQWQDDPARIVPKLSYVRGFAPWGWIIGSGIYMNDVQAEIARSTRHLLWISAGIAALLALLVALGLRQGLLSERLRQSAEDELKRSTARYEALAHAADEAVWLVAGERVAGANRSACRLFGATEAELLGRDAASLFASDAHEPPTGLPHETTLAGAAGRIPALVTVSSANVQGSAARVLTARDLRAGARTDGDERRRREAAEGLLRDALGNALNWLQPITGLARAAPTLPLGSTPAEVTNSLRSQRCGSVLLTAADGGVAGILSAGDMLRRGGETAYAAMSAPVHGLRKDASLAEAADALAASPGHHLLITDKDAPPALLSTSHVLEALRQNPVVLSAAIGRATQEELSDLRQRMLQWLRALRSLQVDAETLSAEATRVADAVLQRCISLTLAEMGPPPAPFELIVVGSQGRREMMPGSDQDNALIYADGVEPHWYRAFARELVARYAAAGWPRCEGGTVCANDRWCLPLSAWRAQFSEWIEGGSPQALLDVATFFDLRPVWGDAALSDALRAHALTAAASREVFLLQLSRNTLDFRLPLNTFGSIRTDDEHANTLDLKGCLLHFSSFARVEALRHGISATGTGERLRALALDGKLSQALSTEAQEAWRFLLGQRLRQRCSLDAQDRIQPDALSAWDLAALKRALTVVGSLQNHLRHDLERAG